jgi:uncharacterized protein (TIRG00374 family)
MPRQKAKDKKSPLSLRNSILLSALGGLAVFVALSIYANIDAVIQAFAQFQWLYIPLILALTFANYMLRFYKWDYYLRKIGVRLKFKDSFMVFLSGLSMAITPGKIGEVFKSYLLKRLNNTAVSRSVPVVFAERVTDVLSLLILAAISFSVLQYGKEVLLITLAILIVLIIGIQSAPIRKRLLAVCRHIPLINKLSDHLRTGFETAYVLFKPVNLTVATLISVVSWGFECLATYFTLVAFGVSASVLLSTFVFSFSSLFGAISMIPGGLVVAEGSFAGLLIMAGIAKGTAASATMIIRFCTLWFGVIVGLITTFLLRKRIA